MSDLRMVENTFANLCRGAAVALTVIVLPPFLTRILSKEAYTTWLLILELSTYVNLLDLGIQTAIGRFVAHYNELGDTKQRNSIISSAVVILVGSGLIALNVVSILAVQLGNIFKDMPVEFQKDARISLLFIGGSLAVSLPFSVFGAVFLGLYRNDVPAWIVGIGKFFTGIFVILIANLTHSIVAMALVVALMTLLTGIWQFIAYKKVVGKSYQISSSIVSKKSLIEIRDSCLALSISTLGALIVSGLDTVIIGFFDYKSIAYYALATTLINFVFGISGAMLNIIVPVASSIGARNEPEKLGELLVSATKYSVVLMIATNLPLLLLSKTVITFWVGSEYSTQTSHLFELLIFANFLRQIGSPYFMIAIGCGEHKKIILSPLIEASVNLFFSLVLAMKIGAAGVVIGTIIGGFFSVGLHFLYNLPRTKKIIVANKIDLITAIFNPVILVSVPLSIAYVLMNNPSGPIWISLVLIPVSWFILWKYGLNDGDRLSLYSAVEKTIKKKQLR
jgi:O-antigen/teichoic acid export membrane protein